MRAALLLALLVLAPVAARAQSEDDALRFTARPSAFSARMVGLGGVGAAGIADASALITNPAGLGYFQKSEISGSLQTLSVTDDGVFSAPGSETSLGQDVRSTGLANFAYIAKAPTRMGSLVFGASYHQINAYDRELRFSGSNNQNSITDFFMPVRGEFDVTVKPGQDGTTGTADDVYDVGFNRPLSFIAYQTYAIDFNADDYLTGVEVPFRQAVLAGTVDQEGRVTEGGASREVNFGGAVEGVRGVMFGASANLVFGKYTYNRTFSEFDTDNANNGTGGTTDFESLDFSENFESNLLGINGRIGLSAVAAPGVRFGLSLETPTYYNVKEEYGTILDTYFDNGDNYNYGRNADDDEGAGEFEYTITTPWRLSGGVAFERNGLLLSADAELVDWTQMKMDAKDDPEYFDPVNQSIRDNLRAVVNTRVGAEYWLGSIGLRAGVTLQPEAYKTPLRDASGAEISGTRSTVGLGLGYRLPGQLQIDFGWAHDQFKDQYRPYDIGNGSPLVSEDVSRNRFVVGLKFMF